MTTPTTPEAAQVRAVAFRRLLHIGTPVTSEQLADDLNTTNVHALVDELADQGRIRLDDEGRIVGSAGLNVRPDRHEIDLDGRRFWTWCAYDFLGIFAALGARGEARSTSPDGQHYRIRFRDGQPEPRPLVLFLPDEDYAACCTSMYEQWCPNSNLFGSTAAATSWASAHRITGQVLTLPQAAERGAARWAPLARTPAR